MCSVFPAPSEEEPMKIGISLPVRELENDLGAIKAFAEAADELGFAHLRVPDQVIRHGGGHLHEPMTILAYIAAVTSDIELVPSVIILPSRQTVLVAKQAAELDLLTGGRVRLGIGVGNNADEYLALGQDFKTRGARCVEQIELLRLLWTRETVEFEGNWDKVSGAGINPLPIQRPIPIWMGTASDPVVSVIKRLGRQTDGWFVICTPENYMAIMEKIREEARSAGRDPSTIGSEAGVAVVGPRESEWQDRVSGWREAGLTHVCLRTLGGKLKADEHVSTMRRVASETSINR